MFLPDVTNIEDCSDIKQQQKLEAIVEKGSQWHKLPEYKTND